MSEPRVRFRARFCCLAVAAVIGAGSAQAARVQQGTASWYGQREAGHTTASGAVFDPARLTAAHRTLPFGTCVRVTRLSNGRSVIVPIIDRGPYIHGRLIDVSEAAANALDMKRDGLATVRIEVVETCAVPVSLAVN